MTLTEFLLARIAEDERAADDALGESWIMSDGDWTVRLLEHHDPARVLADCEARREIVKLHRLIESSDWRAAVRGHWKRDFPALQYACFICDGEDWSRGTNGCATIRLLALPYADHPDYREEWKP